MAEKNRIIRIGGEVIYVTEETAEAYYETLVAAQKSKKTSGKVANVIVAVALIGLITPVIVWLFRWALGAL